MGNNNFGLFYEPCNINTHCWQDSVHCYKWYFETMIYFTHSSEKVRVRILNFPKIRFLAFLCLEILTTEVRQWYEPSKSKHLPKILSTEALNNATEFPIRECAVVQVPFNFFAFASRQDSLWCRYSIGRRFVVEMSAGLCDWNAHADITRPGYLHRAHGADVSCLKPVLRLYILKYISTKSSCIIKSTRSVCAYVYLLMLWWPYLMRFPHNHLLCCGTNYDSFGVMVLNFGMLWTL